MGKKLKIENKRKKEKWNIFGTVENGFSKTVLTGPRIELFFNNRMILEGCLGIFEYNDNYLKLRLSHGALVLEGNDFDIVSFEDKTIMIDGKIQSIEFCV